MSTTKLFTLLLFALISLAGIAQVDDIKSPLGKWYGELDHDSDDAYTNIEENGLETRWFEFKENNEFVRFNCTDMCGCMGATYYGKIKWANDSIVVVNYNRMTQMFDTGELKKSKCDKQEELKIIQESPTILIIEELKSIYQK